MIAAAKLLTEKRTASASATMIFVSIAPSVSSCSERGTVEGTGRRSIPLHSFRDFHEPFLNELRRSRHSIRVDLDSGKQVCVSPLVSFRGRATQLNLRTAFHQVSDELLVGIAGRHCTRCRSTSRGPHSCERLQ